MGNPTAVAQQEKTNTTARAKTSKLTAVVINRERIRLFEKAILSNHEFLHQVNEMLEFVNGFDLSKPAEISDDNFDILDEALSSIKANYQHEKTRIEYNGKKHIERAITGLSFVHQLLIENY